MLKYGYPWPKIVHCDQFPIDNDMCIQAQHSSSAQSPSQSLTDKDKHINNNDKKHRKGNKKNAGKKQRKDNPTDNSDFPAAKKETIFEPQPGHLQRPSQLDSETKLRQEPQVDQVINNNEQITQSPKRNWNKDQRQLYNDIITQFCNSQWSKNLLLYLKTNNKTNIQFDYISIKLSF